MHNQIPGVFAALLYLCGLLLFLEWLYPIQQVTDTSNLTIFIFYALVCFVISLLRFPGWLSVLLKGAGLLFVIHRLFYETALLNPLWLKAFGDQVFYNLQIFYSQQWYAFSPEFRSLLFLVLIWLMSYLIHYWFVYVKRILLFVIMTFVYLSVLDVFQLTTVLWQLSARLSFHFWHWA
ncbi:hypothetical protein P5G51_015495 [Virgibacillus sp. 179-BFC.A HS]|uniref:Uncharacterized protein n=1 Tax=Tigheibacillus jepli TaxID=3035914 RepID=A0ABU5CK15_9BACI|nr:hypothetical protein [Virgibacillus sp. 179-BFC.A HS]MDY0406580.1 hypothetical protein [Virgibacillus sp. 179-BFC.A HS]